MLNKPKKLTKILIVSGLLMASQYSYAQIGYVRSNYSDAQLAAAKCDRNVLNRMEALAEARYNGQYNKVSELYVKQQLEATPKDATNKMLSCVDGALRQFDGVANNIMGVYNTIKGLLDMDLAAVGAKALNQISNQACSAINSYTSNKAYSAVAPYNSAITSVPNSINNAIGGVGNIDTPFGNVGVGSMVGNEIRQNAGPTPTGTIFRDGAKNVLGNGSNSPTPAPATPPIWK